MALPGKGIEKLFICRAYPPSIYGQSGGCKTKTNWGNFFIKLRVSPIDKSLSLFLLLMKTYNSRLRLLFKLNLTRRDRYVEKVTVSCFY